MVRSVKTVKRQGKEKKQRHKKREKAGRAGKKQGTPPLKWTQKDEVALVKRLCKFFRKYYEKGNSFAPRSLKPFCNHVNKYLDNQYTPSQICKKLLWLRTTYEATKKEVFKNPLLCFESDYDAVLYKWASKAWPDEEEKEMDEDEEEKEEQTHEDGVVHKEKQENMHEEEKRMDEDEEQEKFDEENEEKTHEDEVVYKEKEEKMHEEEKEMDEDEEQEKEIDEEKEEKMHEDEEEAQIHDAVEEKKPTNEDDSIVCEEKLSEWKIGQSFLPFRERWLLHQSFLPFRLRGLLHQSYLPFRQRRLLNQNFLPFRARGQSFLPFRQGGLLNQSFLPFKVRGSPPLSKSTVEELDRKWQQQQIVEREANSSRMALIEEEYQLCIKKLSAPAVEKE